MKTTKSLAKPPACKRRLPNIDNSRSRLDEKLLAILEERDQRTLIYVYRAEDDRPVPPYLFKCCPFPDLTHRIRSEHGPGDYALVIRQGDHMLLSGTIAIGTSLNWQYKR